ncbi:MAG: hypothetical protein CM15mP120_01810 [Pseudomonadota bacterium]|nr:MAG: hypothetical protein CM15mP120_01810 [Pseudomonadota bacterium]
MCAVAAAFAHNAMQQPVGCRRCDQCLNQRSPLHDRRALYCLVAAEYANVFLHPTQHFNLIQYGYISAGISNPKSCKCRKPSAPRRRLQVTSTTPWLRNLRRCTLATRQTLNLLHHRAPKPSQANCFAPRSGVQILRFKQSPPTGTVLDSRALPGSQAEPNWSARKTPCQAARA